MHPTSKRILAYDRARALAVMGMVLVNTSTMMGLCSITPKWIDAVVDFICGRAAVVFVMLAGVGMTLVYDRTPAAEAPRLRIRLVKRAAALLLAGLLLIPIWQADILHYYAAYFFMGLWLLDAKTRYLKKTLKGIVLISVPVGALIAYDYQGGEVLGKLEDLPGAVSFFSDYFFSVFYPILPWYGFFLTGMLLGRFERTPTLHRYPILVGGGIVVCGAAELLSALLNSERVVGRWVDIEAPLWQAITLSEAFPANPLFIFSAGAFGVALIAFCRMLPERSSTASHPGPMVAFGRLSLTLYISHILASSAYHQWILATHGSASSEQMLFFSTGFILAGIAFATAWTRHFKRGPLEQLMDALTRLSLTPPRMLKTPHTPA